MLQNWTNKIRTQPWLFIALYSLALIACSILLVSLNLPDNLLIIFIIAITFAAFTYERWVAWLSLVLLIVLALWVVSQISINIEASIKTIIVATVSELIIIEIVSRLTQSRRDVTQKLQESQEKYRSLVDQIPIGIYRTNEDGLILHANSPLARMLGFDNPDELINHYHAQDFYQTKDEIAHQRVDYKNHGINVHELELQAKDGRLIWVKDTAHAIYNENGQLLYVDGSLEDITERKHIEEEFSRDRKLLRTLIDNIPDRIYAKDLDGRKVLSNPADYLSIGLESYANVLGKTDFDLMSQDLAERYWKDDLQVIQTGVPLINRVEPGPDASNDQKWILTTKVPLYDEQGNITGLVGIGRDITERRQIEEALHTANRKLTRWVDELEQRNRESKLLNDMGELLQSCHSVEEAYDVIAQSANRMFAQQYGELYILNNSRNLIEIVTSWGNFSEDNLNEKPGERVANPNDCWALRRGRVHLNDGSDNRLRCKHMGEVDQGASVPYICVPLAAQGETLGMMHIRFLEEEQAKAGEQMVISMAERSALALANLKLGETLRSQAVRDPLTGLFNRRYMEETLEREIRRAIRYQRPLGMIMLDIDHFKQFNDTFSYAAGDTLLRELGITLRANLRVEDVTCRYGGEEFILILPESSLEDTTKRAEELRLACKRMRVYHREQPLGDVTISIGVSAFPENGDTPDRLLRAVDTALHQSKSNGRDQVTVAQIDQ